MFRAINEAEDADEAEDVEAEDVEAEVTTPTELLLMVLHYYMITGTTQTIRHNLKSRRLATPVVEKGTALALVTERISHPSLTEKKPT